MVKISGYKVHAAADIVPMATVEEQEALKLSIKTGGQEVPITLFKNQIIDGRCRALACEELGIKVIVTHLDDGLNRKEIYDKAMKLNIRRNLSVTQKSIVAYRLWHSGNGALTQETVCAAWGIARMGINAARWIDTNYPALLESLYIGQSVITQAVNPATNKIFPPTKSVQSVYKQLIILTKANKVKADQLPNLTYDYGAKFITRAGLVIMDEFAEFDREKMIRAFTQLVQETEQKIHPGHKDKVDEIYGNYIANSAIEP